MARYTVRTEGARFYAEGARYYAEVRRTDDAGNVEVIGFTREHSERRKAMQAGVAMAHRAAAKRGEVIEREVLP